jgi:exodeoxyribonuclease VII small subunit
VTETPSGEFEKSLKRLEDIVHELEQPDVSLDDSVKLFQEGKTLSNRCEALLKDAQAKIEAASTSATVDEKPRDPGARDGSTLF